MKNIFKIVFVIIGTLIGAGFASGREIYTFFSKFGIAGIFGIAISSSFICLIVYKLLIKIKEKNIENYNELLIKINKKYIKLNKIINLIVNLFLLISFFIMIACFSAYIKQIYNIPIYVSSTVFCLISGIIFLGNINGVIKANEILVPILIFFIVYLGIKNIPYLKSFNFTQLNNTNTKGWFINSLLYVSYNSIVLIPILSNLKLNKLNKKQIKFISIFSGLFILILSILIFGLLLRGEYFIQELELPLVEISKQFGNIFKYIYGIVIIISIYTSAISAGYSLLNNISKNKKQYILYLLIISVIGILVSNVGFSKLVENLYPLFGILGLIQIILIIK